jgi:hypothetical protein
VWLEISAEVDKALSRIGFREPSSPTLAKLYSWSRDPR